MLKYSFRILSNIGYHLCGNHLILHPIIIGLATVSTPPHKTPILTEQPRRWVLLSTSPYHIDKKHINIEVAYGFVRRPNHEGHCRTSPRCHGTYLSEFPISTRNLTFPFFLRIQIRHISIQSHFLVHPISAHHIENKGYNLNYLSTGIIINTKLLLPLHIILS